MIDVKLLLYSKNAITNDILATYELTVPKFLLAELNTHRMLTKSAGSSRALSTKEIRRKVIKEPFIPISFGKNCIGMANKEELNGIRKYLAKRIWLWSRWFAIFFHWVSSDIIKLHKQVVNRILEPWLYVNVIVSGTEWDNFFRLRISELAQPEFRLVAIKMKHLMDNTEPQLLYYKDWHIPFISDDEMELYTIDERLIISSARCARTSYLKHNIDLPYERQLELHDRLKKDRHMSPFEHQAQACDGIYKCEHISNFKGFLQYRKLIEIQEFHKD